MAETCASTDVFRSAPYRGILREFITSPRGQRSQIAIQELTFDTFSELVRIGLKGFTIREEYRASEIAAVCFREDDDPRERLAEFSGDNG